MPQTPMTTMRVPMLQSRADFLPETYNAGERTIDITWTTGARGLRSTWFDEFWEELEVSERAIRLDRLTNGAPFLAVHTSRTLEAVMGVVVRAWIEKGEGRATIRFSQREDVQGFIQDIIDGVIRNISVGYRVWKFEQIEGGADKVPVYRATDWEPLELSAVPVGFDDGAKTRSRAGEQPDFYEAEIVRLATPTPHTPAPGGPTEETQMPHRNQPGGTTPAADPQTRTEEQPVTAPAPVAPPAATQDRAAGVAEERARVAGIMSAVRAARLGDEFATRLINEGVSLDAARAQIIDGWAAQDTVRTVQAGAPELRVVRAEADTRRSAMETALELRAYPALERTFKAEQLEASNRYRGLTLIEFARQAVRDAGGNPDGLGRAQVAAAALNVIRAGGMNSTSDFPLILANIANKTLRRAYEQAPQTWRPLVREVSAADFREMTRVQLGDAPRLLEVKENGEFERGSVGEAKEAYSLKTFGRIVAITRQTIINDDLGAFTRLPELFGRAAADLESDTVWAIITGNPTMNDGTALFHADHDNLGTAAAIAIASLGEGRKLMRLQTGLNGEKINVQANFLVVPSALETVAEQYLTSTQIVYQKSSEVNPFAGKLQLVVEPRLDANSATAWYLAADPNQIDTIEVAYLEGQRGVYTETREGFDVDGVEVKCRLDFGAAAIDHRGLVKNAGA